MKNNNLISTKPTDGRFIQIDEYLNDAPFVHNYDYAIPFDQKPVNNRYSQIPKLSQNDSSNQIARKQV